MNLCKRSIKRGRNIKSNDIDHMFDKPLDERFYIKLKIGSGTSLVPSYSDGSDSYPFAAVEET